MRNKMGQFVKGCYGDKSPKWVEKAKKKCKYCNKSFLSQRSQNRKFCSLNCKLKWQSSYYKNKGNPNWQGGDLEMTCHICDKSFYIKKSSIREINFCSTLCRGKWTSKILKGKNHYNWKGGISKLNNQIRTCLKMLEWKKKCFKRDSYTCQKCGKNGTSDLIVHHIIQFALILERNNIKSLEDAINCIELWNIDNGIVLCEDCHKLTKSYKRINNKWEHLIGTI